MDGVVVTPLKKIYHPKGNILHILKKSDKVFQGFGEAYFSIIKYGEIKGWKKHTKMTLNLVVPIGVIEFLIYDEREKDFFNIKISQNNYKRLTVKPGLWMAFRGIGKNQNILLNLSNIEHNQNEAVNIDLDKIKHKWSKNK